MIVLPAQACHFGAMDTVEYSEFIKKQTFVAFDTETTGLWAISNRLVEIAAVRFSFEKGQIDSFQSLINPQRKIPPEVIRIHGITDRMVADADPAGPVLTRFFEWIQPDEILIAHNAPFDISFIACELERKSMDFCDNYILDTVDIFRRCFPHFESYSLLSLVLTLDIAHSQEHRALGDAMLVKKLFAQASDKFADIEDEDDLFWDFTVHTLGEGRAGKVRLPVTMHDLNRAVDEGLRIEMVYESAGKPPKSRIVRPIALHDRGDHIYMVAHCELAGEERTFRIDRIHEFSLLPPSAPHKRA